MRGRRIAFDYGDVRIGLAVCDPDGILSSPLPAIRTGDSKLFASIEKVLDEYQPIAIYIGLPLHMSGESGDSAEKARAFGEEISDRFKIPVHFIDERLSTVSAQRKLKDAGVSSRESKDLIDSMAAVSILEQGLLSED
jgi:putative Holliday junction resolvase